MEPSLPPAALQPPPAALAGCVRAYIWRDLAALPPTAPRDTRVPAGPYPGLSWLVRGAEVLNECAGQAVERPWPAIAVSGAHRHAYHSTAAPGTDFFCVAFEPCALAWLTGLDLHPLTDAMQDAPAWLSAMEDGDDWLAWLQAMQDAASHSARMALAEAFLQPRWAAAQQRHAAWLPLLAQGFRREARQALAERLGCTPRHLQRQVRSLTGLRAGEVERMLRVEQALLAMRDANATALDAALGNGYADQAHFCREARALFERPPALLRQHMHGSAAQAADAHWLLRR
ncbi:hypothetical protein GCM10027082_40190 [Comamonas humi]